MLAPATAAYLRQSLRRLLDDIGAIVRPRPRSLTSSLFDYSRSPRASVRSPIHVIEAARMGADVVTVPPAVIDQCFKHPLTDIGLEKFLKDWEKAQGAKV